MKELNQWFNNSKTIAKQAGDNYEDKFIKELEKRKNLLNSFKLQEIQITPQIVSGTYRAIGQNPDDKDSCYIGNVDIFFEDNVWRAKWNISGYIHNGYGMLITPNILVFNYSYFDADSQKKTGIVAYTYLSSKIIKGSWLEEGFSFEGIEELRRLEADEDPNPDSHDSNLGFSLN